MAPPAWSQVEEEAPPTTEAHSAAAPKGETPPPEPVAASAATDPYADLSLEELLQTKIITISKMEESVFDAPGIVEVITSQDIEAFGAVNLWEVLDRATGLVMTNTPSLPKDDVIMRGDAVGTDLHVLVLIDGRPFRESATGGQNFPIYSSFPLQMVERVEIVRGPGSVLYGTNAYSGVINIITKKADRLRGEVAAQYGSFRTAQGNASVGYVWKDLQVFAAAKVLNSRGWRQGFTDGLGVYDSRLAHERNVGVTLGARLKGFSLNTFLAQSEQPILSASGNWPATSKQARRLFVDLGYTHQLGSRWTVSANLTHNGNRVEAPLVPVTFPFEGNRPLNYLDSQDLLGELTLNGELFRGLRLILGGVANYQQGGGLNGPPPPEGQGVDVPLTVVQPYDGIWWSGYGQLEYRPTPFLKLIAGGQAVKPRRVDAAFVPRFGTILHFIPELGVKLLYGEAFRYSYALETDARLEGVAFFGNPSLRPERVATTDLQLFYTRSRFQAAATYFRSRQRDLIVQGFDPGLEGVTFFNQNARAFQGVELETKVVATQAIQLTGGYSFQTSEGGTENVGVSNAALVANHALKVGASYRSDDGITFGLFNTFYSRFRDPVFLNPERLEVNAPATAVSLLSANISLDVVRIYDLKVPYGMILDLYATNLFDTPAYQPDFYTQSVNALPSRPGRAVFAQVRVRY
ncbi:MAG TPA: TonB-dependent receptor [Myxococcaceae bacterium]|nr:TonB-dependent receptor [Myxococcaceae bacterium]